MKSVKKIFLVLAVAMLMFSYVLATSYAVNVEKNDKKYTGITIDSKSKTVSYTITWNANGGKIGSKKTVSTNVKKGSKIGKLAATPKLSGYKFKGWYSKKTGGSKITKNSKPRKSVTYYAQWMKGSSSANSNLEGHWQYKGLSHVYDPANPSVKPPTSFQYYYYDYYFYKDGKFKYFYYSPTWLQASKMYSTTHTITEGKYKISNGKIYFSDIIYERGESFETRYKDTVFEYKFGKDTVGEYLFMPSFQYDTPYLDISWAVRFRAK